MGGAFVKVPVLLPVMIGVVLQAGGYGRGRKRSWRAWNERGRNMNKTLIGGIIGAILVVILTVWLLGVSGLSCHESFWNKDKTVIEFKRG